MYNPTERESGIYLNTNCVPVKLIYDICENCDAFNYIAICREDTVYYL